MMKQEHKNKRKESINATRERHKNMVCKTYQIKFDKSHLSKQKSYDLYGLFLEAKWLYNHTLSQENIFSVNSKIREVEILNKDKEKEPRELRRLSSQMRQQLVQRQKQNIVNLSKAKVKGQRVGQLKFKSYVNSIPLKQYNITYKIVDNKYIKLQGLKYKFKAMGLNQIPDEAEYANANLVHKNKNYYLYITCYLPKEQRELTGKKEAIDAGIKTALTKTTGKEIDIRFPETYRLKQLQRLLARQKKNSKRYNKTRFLLNQEYEKLGNRKKDAINKVYSELKNKYDVIYYQDENIKGWHSELFGKTIQHSIIGGVYSRLRNLETAKEIEKWYPSTQECPRCKKKTKIPLSQRYYKCEYCGYCHKNRDQHAALNIYYEGERIYNNTNKIGYGESHGLNIHKNVKSLEEAKTSENLAQASQF